MSVMLEMLTAAIKVGKNVRMSMACSSGLT
jgi:hypothetical protein